MRGGRPVRMAGERPHEAHDGGMLSSVHTVRASPIALYTPADIPHPERALRARTVTRVRPGVYADRAEWEALAAWDRYLARVHAVALVHPEAIFSHESACALWGLPVFSDPVVVHVLVRSNGNARLLSGIRTHTSVGDRTIAEAGGVLLASVADSVVDVARHRHAAIGLSVADAALRADPLLCAEQLLDVNELRASKRGRALARWPIAHSTPIAESAFESVSRGVVGWLGFPPPDLQVEFRSVGGQSDRGDYLWRPESLVGEADGDAKFDGRYGEATALLAAQRARDARLRTHVRTVVHWGWSDISSVGTPLRGILLGAGLRPVEREDTAQLATLRRALASRPSPPTTR